MKCHLADESGSCAASLSESEVCLMWKLKWRVRLGKIGQRSSSKD